MHDYQLPAHRVPLFPHLFSRHLVPSRDRKGAPLTLFLLSLAIATRTLCAQSSVLVVCADPNNLPFSNRAGQGFENRIAALLAKDLHMDLQYTWWTERKSFLKNTLDTGECDVVMGVPAHISDALTTEPYYRSTYVLVTRKSASPSPPISSLMDTRLESLRIGIHVTDSDYTPPAHLLARRGLATNLVGYSLYGTAGEENPPARLIDAVAAGKVDIAVVWGPFAGYFAKAQPQALTVTPVSPAAFMGIPFTYAISAAVRAGNTDLEERIQAVLTRECAGISRILAEYAVPLTQEGQPKCDASPSRVSYSH